MPDFTDKIVIVTGASTGIGRATAIAFREAGARVVLAARSTDQIEMLAQELGGEGVALPVTTDVGIEEQCDALISRSVEAFDRIDILVNNAGMLVSGRFEHLQSGDMERQFSVNYFGVIYCIRAALPHLKQSRGVIVNISSIAGFIGTPTTSAYAASKAALNSLGQSLAVELEPYGIGVSTVCPYFTSGAELSKKGVIRQGSMHKTNRRKRKAPGTQSAEQVADAILRAADKRERLMVLSATGRLIWRFNRLTPWLTDYIMTRGVKRLTEGDGE